MIRGIYVEALRNFLQILSPDGMMDACAAEAGSSEKVRNARIGISNTLTNEFLGCNKECHFARSTTSGPASHHGRPTLGRAHVM
jgi:hypothetical protein